MTIADAEVKCVRGYVDEKERRAKLNVAVAPLMMATDNHAVSKYSDKSHPPTS